VFRSDTCRRTPHDVPYKQVSQHPYKAVQSLMPFAVVS
jgi:hypothetical protein